MTDSKKKNSANNEEQYLKDMKDNTELFEQKFQKLKKKAKELQQKENNKKVLIYTTKPLNKNIDKKFGINDKSNTLELKEQLNEQFPRSNTLTFYKNSKDHIVLSRVESKKLMNASINQDYGINDDNDTNTSINKYYTFDDEFFNDISIRKDYKIKELIKKNKQLKDELEYKDSYIESLEKEIQIHNEFNNNSNNNNFNNFVSQSKLDEINFEMGKLTRELEEKNQKIENFEINNKNLSIKIENLIMQNKNLSNREKKLIDKNEYLTTNLDKMKDDNENYKKKIFKLETLNQNILKDYEELSSDFSQMKKQKEKIESLTDEQKTKIIDLNKQIKTLHNILEETIKQQKRKKYYNNNNIEYDSDDDNDNMKIYKKKKVRLNMYQNNNDNYIYNNDSDEYDNYNNNSNYIYKKKKYQLNPSKTMQNFYSKNKNIMFNKRDLEYDDEYDNDNIIYDNNHKYYNRINNNKNYNTINDLERDDYRRYSEIIGRGPSSSKHKKRKNNKYLNMDDQNDMYNGIDMDEVLNHYYSTRNIFDGNKSSKKKINGKQYLDYDGYEGFNCFPSERKKIETEELNNDLNMLLKKKNILENNLMKLPGQSKTLNDVRRKKELNKKIILTENKINEIRVRLKQLKGL